MTEKARIVMGVDPGFALTGYGIIKVCGNKMEAVDYGVIETKVGEDFNDRLYFLHNELTKIIKKNKPEMVGVEELFFNKNVTTALKVGQARGVILLTVRQANLPVYEYTPSQVKQAISCYGKADKKQVQQMVTLLLQLQETPKPDDVADALAVAMCTANSYTLNNYYA
ncbi:crossover junction endodeoxyribonuclease RuvC [Candidatus Falkowbacteria bacterium CG10_big_fil_rev_8_21_14_0_10_39_11]|uniref:Crossover junction endodeoxyribonuclease RuvC n=1 Tax=Candidatus Falkowbacteria bacterium CG10_big_fil_rev_8_21_14_0_10_39_11 TaxID=1974565 RepID=A0A2H0V5P4_9BACT|nr:MAG: crossover junction endodeoxyribonuclease RuvC [Candidatus Falkowbacteria bacterium CG10_big_fil_rev_8_21_14_0_10_39_11]